MKTAISIIRILILLTLGLLALFLFICEEHDESIINFTLHVIIDKLIGLAALGACIYLYDSWSWTDKWLSRFGAWTRK